MPRFPCPDPTLPSRLRANSDCPLTPNSRNMASPRLMMLPATANDEAVQLGTTVLVSVLNDHVDIDPFLSSAPSVLVLGVSLSFYDCTRLDRRLSQLPNILAGMYRTPA